MGPIGLPEMVVILVIALVVFGPRKLPELGRSLGKSLNEFKKASHELRSTWEDEVRVEEQREQRAKVEAEQKSATAAAEVAGPDVPAGDVPAADATPGDLDTAPTPEAAEKPTVSRTTSA